MQNHRMAIANESIYKQKHISMDTPTNARCAILTLWLLKWFNHLDSHLYSRLNKCINLLSKSKFDRLDVWITVFLQSIKAQHIFVVKKTNILIEETWIYVVISIFQQELTCEWPENHWKSFVCFPKHASLRPCAHTRGLPAAVPGIRRFLHYQLCPSLTGDCWLQLPTGCFWTEAAVSRDALQHDRRC